MKLGNRVKLGDNRVDLRNNRATGFSRRAPTKKPGSTRGQNRLS
jgi:hypothetical protein